jgi:hypothetical protein
MFALGLVGVVVGWVSDAAASKAIQHFIAPSQAGGAVWSMIEGFRSRSPEAYVAPMSEDFRFDSDDPSFIEAFPHGMTRADEAAFATHLFRGGKSGPDGRPLPTATSVSLSAGPVIVSTEVAGARTMVVRVEHLVVWIGLTSGDTMQIADTRNEIGMTLTPDGWRVSRWHESHRTPADAESLASRLARAAVPSRPVPPASPSPRPERRPTRGALAAPSLDLPTRLELAVRADVPRSALVFDLAMPRPGGSLEVFDVQGRRVALRDLSDLGAGRHHVAMDVASLGSGVYFARVRQEGNVATARIVWAR